MLLLETALLVLMLSCALSAASASGLQSPLLPHHRASDPTHVDEQRIAIIGAGVGGATAAFHIHENNRNRNERPQTLTIFERESNVGGRVQSTYLYPPDDGLRKIEEGATQFFPDDWCLVSVMQNVGLRPPRPRPRRASQSKFRWTDDDVRTDLDCNAVSDSWQDLLYGRWKYGQSWSTLNTAVRSALEEWNTFGSPYRPPFHSIQDALDQASLPKPVYGSATSYLQNLAISPELQNRFIQPCVRARSSQNLSGVSGLSALMAAGKSKRTSIDGGNSRLTERMIQLSEADLQLTTIVSAITPGFSRRYKLSVSHMAANESFQLDDVEFDIILLAAPLLGSEIDLSRLNLHASAVPPAGVETHVTHFSSSFTITSNFSILPLDISIHDEMTLTTSNVLEDSDILNLQRSDACFRRGCLPGDDCDQCDDDEILYRVHSRRYMEDGDLVRMLGKDWEETSKLSDYGIQYVRRRIWPYTFPKIQEGHLNFLDEIEIAPGFYYLNGAESVMCSMEMSCRMGRNVAKLVTRSSWSWM